MVVTEQQSRVSKQSIQSRYVRLELLNYNFQKVDEVQGVAISGSFTIDANADIRRTGSVTLVVKDSSFEIEPSGKIWLERYIKVYVGTQSFYTGQVEWTNCGIYIIDAPNYSFDASTNTLTLSLLDLMAKLTGLRNGNLVGVPTVISAGESIRSALIDTLALGGFNRYVITEPPTPATVPNDLKFSQGSTVYDVLLGLKEIYPYYEMFFDVEGVFYYKPIPSGEAAPVEVGDDLWDNVVISEELNVDFQNVKNTIEVFGRIHDPSSFSTQTTVDGTTIQLTLTDVYTYADLLEGVMVGFTLTDNEGIEAPQIQVNNLESLPVYMSDGETPASIKAETGEVYYCAIYHPTYWEWVGHLQAYGFAQDTNPESPFNVNGEVGVIRLPLYDGEYADCMTDDLAQQRAEYELWLHTNMNDTIQLTIIPCFWLDVNILTNYTLKRNNETRQYLIKSISFGLEPSSTSVVEMMRYYQQ